MRALANELRALALRLEAEAASIRAKADALESPGAEVWLTFAEARPLLPGCSVEQWRTAVRSGALPARRRGRAYVALRADVEAWAASRLKAPPSPRVRPPRVRVPANDDTHEPEDELQRRLRRRA
ncbi:MAG: helix-turn-helix domain-containing protein [Polyangiaceae bacterium]